MFRAIDATRADEASHCSDPSSGVHPHAASATPAAGVVPACHRALALGRDVDPPRNLAKGATVEQPSRAEARPTPGPDRSARADTGTPLDPAFADGRRRAADGRERRALDVRLSSTPWDTHSGPVRILLSNQYVYGPFCDRAGKSEKGGSRRRRFEKDGKNADDMLAESNVHGVLMEVFLRLCVLRNPIFHGRIFHGGATFASGWGRSRIRDGSRIMAALGPEILRIMQADVDASPGSDPWGTASCPRINEDPDSIR